MNYFMYNTYCILAIMIENALLIIICTLLIMISFTIFMRVYIVYEIVDLQGYTKELTKITEYERKLLEGNF